MKIIQFLMFQVKSFSLCFLLIHLQINLGALGITGDKSCFLNVVKSTKVVNISLMVKMKPHCI